MESIFFEKQEGSLCAQHCLNSLLQGNYFTVLDLADIARSLDEEEGKRMAEAGEHSTEYQHFLSQPSSNMDDRGFFSIQVITDALKVWNVELIPYNSQDEIAIAARKGPVEQKAFICNMRQHWFSVRKLGQQWFNLNSLLTGPQLISDTYLSLFLTQLQQEGYSIFIIVGNLPECDADRILRYMIVTQTIKPKLNSVDEDQPDPSLREIMEASRKWAEKEDPSLQRVLKLSMEDRQKEEDASLEKVLQMSLQNFDSSMMNDAHSSAESTFLGSDDKKEIPISQEDLRNKRLAYFSKPKAVLNGLDAETKKTTVQTPQHTDEGSTEETSLDALSEEEMLQKAIAMSMGVQL